MPRISVIVPVYKVEAYLPRCLDSILAQTFTDYELWLVDDGSPDNCGVICDQYVAQDQRIQVIHKKNGGLSDARNAALERASGDFISFVDSDDWVTPDFLESLFGAMQRHHADIAICNMLEVRESAEPVVAYKPVDSETVVEGSAIFETLYQPSAANKLYCASIFRTLRYPVGRWYEDVFVYTDVLAQVKRLAYTGKASYYYFMRDSSIMHSEYRLQSTDIIDACDLRAQKLDELGQPKHANLARLHVYSQLAVAYAKLDRKLPENAARLKQLQAVYDRHYPALMHYPENSAKQKLRLWLLHVSPTLHTAIYGGRQN